MEPNNRWQPQMTQNLSQPHKIKRLQEVIGVFLFYARAIDSSLLPALSSLAAAQTEATENTLMEMNRLMDYVSTNPMTTIRFRRSKMILAISSDASYLSEPKSRSRVGGYFYLSEEPNNEPGTEPPPHNGAIHVISTIIKNVVGSATEAEIAACYTNGTEGCPIITTLKEMGWPQGTVQISTDNQCAEGFANERNKAKQNKSN